MEGLGPAAPRPKAVGAAPAIAHSDYGRRWGEGAARCFSIDADCDEDEGLRLLPIPECFVCPMTQAVMKDPVMTVDGCTYERSYIEQWIRHRQQQKMRVTSPATNEDLTSHRLLSLAALRKAIEVYLAHRPELTASHLASRSFEEAAHLLQNDLLDKQAIHAEVEGEFSSLKESNEALLRSLRASETTCEGLRLELKHTRLKVCQVEDELRKGQREFSTSQGLAIDGDVPPCDIAARETPGESGSSVMPKLMALAHNPNGCGPEFGNISGQVGLLEGSSEVAKHKSGTTEGLPPLSHIFPSKAGSCQAMRRLVFFHIAAIMIIAQLMVLGHRCGDCTNAELVSLSLPNVSSLHKSLDASPGLGLPDLTTPELIIPRVQPMLPNEERKEAKKDRRKHRGDVKKRASSNQDDRLIFQQVLSLRAGPPDQRIEAALLLGILAASNPENQASIVRAGAILPLVDLLKSSLPDAQGQAAVALRALACHNTYIKVAIVRAGAIAHLIKLLRDGSLDVQEVAAGALQTIAETNNQVEIAQAGAVVPLVALLQDEAPGIREEAAGALAVLSAREDNQAAIAQVGAIPLLIDLLRDEAPEVREQAAAALRNLAAENADNQAEIAKAGALAPLSALLSDGMPGVRERALAALRSLAAAPNRGSAASADVMEAAVGVAFAIKEAAAIASESQLVVPAPGQLRHDPV